MQCYEEWGGVFGTEVITEAMDEEHFLWESERKENITCL